MTIEEITQQRDDAYKALVETTAALKKVEQYVEAAKREVKLHRDEINYWSEQFRIQENTRKQPSRLEIAATFMVGSWARNDSSLTYEEAWEMAGSLIQVANERK